MSHKILGAQALLSLCMALSSSSLYAWGGLSFPAFVVPTVPAVQPTASVTTDDLDDGTDEYTYRGQLMNNAKVDLKLNLADIFLAGQEAHLKMIVNAANISDLAPDCTSVAKALSLKGLVNCSARKSGQFVSLGSTGTQRPETCRKEMGEISKTEHKCTNPPAYKLCKNQRHGGVRGRGGDLGNEGQEHSGCLEGPICGDVIVKIKEEQTICTKSHYEVNLVVDDYRSATSNQIVSNVLIKDAVDVQENKRQTSQGTYPTRNDISLTQFAGKFLDISSEFYLEFVCENGQKPGLKFNDFTNSQELFYDTIVQRCGEGGNLVLKSNREAFFDKGEINFTFERN